MMKKIAISCGLLNLFLWGQTPSDVGPESRSRCISVGPSGALVCHDGTLDIVTAVVPRLIGANHFTGLNIFSKGVMIDTREDERPECQEALRGTFWFRRGERRDGMQVCVRHEGKFAWANMELHTEQQGN